MPGTKKFISNLSAIDFIVIVFALILSFINVIYSQIIPHAFLLIQANFVVIIIILYIAYIDQKRDNKFFMFLHDWYLVPLIFITFKEIYLLVKSLCLTDYDELLISIDRFFLGTDVTHVLDKIANPVLTELLQISYATFFLLPIILGIEIQRKRNINDFRYATFLVVYGFFLSYMGYFIFPAVGPRFYLYDFLKINVELPGIFFTKLIRDILDLGESIQPGMVNPIAFVQRDVFPSGHTDITLIVMYLAIKFKLKSRYFLIPNGLLLIFSTMYLRYHYAIDVLAGIIFMIITIWSGHKIYNFWQNFKNEPPYSFPKI